MRLENAVADPTAYCRTVTVTSTGAAAPDVGENNASVGTTAWTNPGNVIANDGAEATCNAGADSQYLVVRDFDFAIPTGATIETIRVDVEASEHSTDMEALSVNLQDGSGNLIPHGAVAYSVNGTTPTVYTAVGTPADAWIVIDGPITPAMVNDPDFGVRLRFGTAHDVRIDYVTMTVTYTNTDETAGIAGLDSTNIVSIVDTDGQATWWDGDSWQAGAGPGEGLAEYQGRSIVNDTDGATLTANQVLGHTYTNTGASGLQTFHLPPAVEGMSVTFLLTERRM